MTPERLKEIKAWSIYIRERCADSNCLEAARCLPDCITEIERLQALVKAAYREGAALSRPDQPACIFDEDNYYWDHSKARETME